MTQWTVTAPANHVALDPHRRGAVPFTVTNAGQSPDVAVFGAVAGDGADPSWFAVADPQRTVPPGGSVSYLLTIGVPAHTAPGRYAVAGRVYSVSQPPEETSRTSGWIVFDVPAAGAPPRPSPSHPAPPQGQRWWPIAVAAAVGLMAVLVIGWTVVRPWLAEKHEGVIEAEHMEVTSEETIFIATPVCCDDSARASGDAYLWLDAWGADQSGTAKFHMPHSGRFVISVIRAVSGESGIAVLAIDGDQLGEPFDGYQPHFGFTGWDTVGTVELDEGVHELTLTVVGQSANSGGFDAGLDAIRYEST